MDVQVLIERVEGNGYLARSTFGLTAEGATSEEALHNLENDLRRKLAGGLLTTVSLASTAQPNPWLSIAGTWDPDDPVIQEWERILKANRLAADNDPNVF